MGREREVELVRLERVLCVRETEKAICCHIDGEPKWIPKSLVHDDSEVWKLDDEGTLVLPEWFAVKEGLV